MIHDLPLFSHMLETVHVTRDRQGGGVRRRTLRVHGSLLRDVDRCDIDGHPVTSLSRTVVDLARCLPYDQGVAVADRGLAAGCDPSMLAEHLDQARCWQGAPQARRVIAFADGRSESVGESFSRIRLRDAELPLPLLQYEVVDDNGLLIGRCDFVWPARRTVGEFDGLVKYGRYRNRARQPARPFTARVSVRMRCAIMVGRWPAGRGTTSGSRRDSSIGSSELSPDPAADAWRVVRPQRSARDRGFCSLYRPSRTDEPEQIDRHTP